MCLTGVQKFLLFMFLSLLFQISRNAGISARVGCERDADEHQNYVSCAYVIIYTRKAANLVTQVGLSCKRYWRFGKRACSLDRRCSLNTSASNNCLTFYGARPRASPIGRVNMDESQTKVAASEISLWIPTDEPRGKALGMDVFMSMASTFLFPFDFDTFGALLYQY